MLGEWSPRQEVKQEGVEDLVAVLSFQPWKSLEMI